MDLKRPNLSKLGIEYLRRNKGTPMWACIHCPDRKIFSSVEPLWLHTWRNHKDELARYRIKYTADSSPPGQDDSPPESSNAQTLGIDAPDGEHQTEEHTVDASLPAPATGGPESPEPSPPALSIPMLEPLKTLDTRPLTNPTMAPKQYQTSPHAPSFFTAWKDTFIQEAKEIRDRTRNLLDEIVKEVTPETATFEDVILPVAKDEKAMEHSAYLKWLTSTLGWEIPSVKPHQNRSSFPNRKPRENRRKILRVRIRDGEHQACPDSGSEKNIMEESFAIKHGFTIRRRLKDLKQFELGNGKYIWSVGRVCVPVELPGITFRQKKRWFHVLPNCPVPLILGMKFLREAEILTKNRHMLESCPPDLGNISSLLWIGSPRQRMKCSLDGQDLLAVADTGSDLNLMSLKCAKRGGFHIDRRRECRQRVRVGDGSEAETIGQVYVSNLGLDWRSPETGSPESPEISIPPLGLSGHNLSTSTASRPATTGSELFGAVFHVLPGLPCDVIFGRDLLEITNAFSLCPELSESQHADNDNPFELNVLISLGSMSLAFPIPRRKRRIVAVESAREEHDNERHAEMYRRSQKDDEIALLPVHEQERAKALERRRALAWDKVHINCVHCCHA